MTVRRGDDDEDDGGQWPEADVTNRDSALVVQRRKPLIAAESGPPQVAARIPVGMASTEQLDGFRELRTRLQSMAAGVGLAQFTTLIVPIAPGAGASFIARNLTAAFTLQNRRVAMLIDCNQRNPTQHLALGVRPDDGGLFDFLEKPHTSLEKLVRPTGVPGLHLIPAGQPRSTPREYFSSAPMRWLMSTLREEPYCLVLDGPPTRGSPDARILADLVDFIVLVVGYGRDTSDGIAQASALFDPAKFAGVVFNERG